MAGLAIVGTTAAVMAAPKTDWGSNVQEDLANKAMQLFGVNQTLSESSTSDLSAAQIQADPASIATLAKGLKARVVSASQTGSSVDMMALWPNDANPEWLVACNETSPGDVERINIATGAVTVLFTGTTSCDGVRRTPWGTVMVSEEAGGFSASPPPGTVGGRVYEILDPLGMQGVTLNRATGAFSGGTGANLAVVRPALGRLSFEGFAVYANGVVYYGDEKSAGGGNPAGGYFKYVPTTPRVPGSPAITDLAQSPLASGKVFGFKTLQNGYGENYGIGAWVEIPASYDVDPTATVDLDLRKSAVDLKLTGYYRPEDIDIDREAEAAGLVRWCGNDTGREQDLYFGESVCFVDGTINAAASNTAIPVIEPFVIGSTEFAMMDNMAYQSGRGNWLIHEDGETQYTNPVTGASVVHNNDLWMCLPDGDDADTLSDGCVRVATLNDLSSEWTGGVFDATGTRLFVSAQHPKTGHAVVLEITGWK